MRAVAVAVSGGRDSMALLHATVHAARALGLQVHALHVHHGLVTEADAWVDFLGSTCRRWGRRGLPVTFHVQRLSEQPSPGESLEAWARRQRYRALAEMARATECTLVLLAHHRRDQAETLLLQALRGGGPAGLAAMPRIAQRAGLTWARPWLEQPREAVEAYVRRHRLRYVDDASNQDRRLARNRLRAEVWPALALAFPDAETQLAAAARRAAEAADCLIELAQIDLAAVVVDDAVHLPAWLALSKARRRNVLRVWLGGPESLVQRLATELPSARRGSWPARDDELGLHDGWLRRVRPARSDSVAMQTLDLSKPGDHVLPAWDGVLRVEAVVTGGLPAASLRHASLRARQGAEQFQFEAQSTARSLKKQYQARRVPAWARSGPLVYAQDVLLFVPGLGIDARSRAAPGETQFSLSWLATDDG